MKKQNIILILILIVCVVCAGIVASQTIFSNTEYTTLRISDSCTVEVPVSDEAVNSTDNYGIFIYQDPKHDLNITSFNSQDGVTLSGAVQMASIRDNALLNNKQIIENGTTIYHNEKTGVYSIFIGNNQTHDNILIQCSDLDILMHVLHSVKYSNGESFNNTSTNSASSSSDLSDSNSNSNSGQYDTCIQCGKQVPGTGMRYLCDSCKAERYDFYNDEGYYDSSNYGGGSSSSASGSSSGGSYSGTSESEY